MAKETAKEAELRELFEAGFKWGFYVRDMGKLSRSSPDKDARKAMRDAWDNYWGKSRRPSLVNDYRPKKSAAAAGGK
jgi:hypothetical protein